MKIIFKFILKSIKDNKFRTFLILISITLSSALFFASSAISGTMTKMYLTRIRQYYGTADIIIHSSRYAPDWTFYLNKVYELKNKFEYIIGVIDNYGNYKPNRNETYNVNLKGIELSDLEKFNPISIYEEKDLYPFTGKKIIINKIISDKYNLKLKDNFDVELNGAKQRFIVSAIAFPVGPFIDDGRTILGVVPIDTLAFLIDRRGKVTTALFKLVDVKEKNKMIQELTKLYPKYTVRETFNDAELKKDTDQVAVPFMMMTLLILLVSIFIIYSSFKVITMERLPVIGTFRSIGATKKTTDLVLIIESLTYGIIGGLIGCFLGIIILYVMILIMRRSPRDSGQVEIQVYFDFFQLLGAFMLALVLSFVSSLMPIVKISKIPVKDIVLNKIKKEIKVKSWKTYFGIILLVITIIIPMITPPHMAIIIDTVCMFFSMVGIILLIPVLTNILVKFIENIYFYIFGNVGLLASKNLRENKSILNNITLIAIGISAILMINTVSYNVMNEVTNLYQKADFQIRLWFYRADRSLESRLKTIKGVIDVYGTYTTRDVEVIKSNGKNNNGTKKIKIEPNMIRNIQGINKEKFNNYWKYDIDSRLLNDLEDGRNIILTYTLKEKFAVNKDDTINLVLNNMEKTYRIIGFFYAYKNSGSYALVSDKYLKIDTGDYFYDEIYMKTSLPADEVVNLFKKKFGQWGYWIITKDQMAADNARSTEQIFTILKGFSFISLIIVIFGVMNNFIISFIERKRHLAIFRSVGMSKKQIVKMIFIEALSGGLIGGVIGIFSGLILIFSVEFVMKSMNMYIKMNYSLDLFIYAILSGIIITVFASISPALKSSKLNIIEAIKYE